jgi:tetratricopeptide (TPR) repeat protein
MTDQDRLQLIALTGALVGLAVLGIWGFLKVNRSRRPKPAPPPQASTPWVWVFLILVVGLITYILSGPKQAGRGPTSPTWLAPIISLGLALGSFGLLIGYQLYRHYDRAASRALKRARAGDTEGAIAELRVAMEERKAPEARPDEGAASNPYAAPRPPRRKRPATRENVMGLLHAMREEWPEAYRWFLEAEKVGGRQAHLLGSQGVALWKMGRPEEAVGLLEEACSLEPMSALHPCNLCLVMVDLGRIDEAREQLARAEANYKKHIVFPASARRAIGAEVESLRKKLASFPGDRDFEVFDEL